MDTAELTALTSEMGQMLLAGLPPYEPDQALALNEKMRERGFDPVLVRAVLTQSRLRTQARSKLGPMAQAMLFTDDGLQQATRVEVAAHHAKRYLDAGFTRVADLTCGIGADASVMAGLGLRITAIERDEATAALATVNLRFFPDAKVIHGNALEVDLVKLGIDAAYADPARRSGGKRVFSPSSYSPPLNDLLELRNSLTLGVKIGPGVPLEALPPEAECEWLSVNGHVVECGLWFGALRRNDEPGRTAMLIDKDGVSRQLGPARLGRAQTGPLGPYVYEPDGAIIRAGLVAEVAEQLDGTLVHPEIAYITSDSAQQTPYARGFRVLDSFPFGLKRLKSYLHEREIGQVTIRKRGTAVEPDSLRKQLALQGDQTGSIILTRIGDTQSVIVVEDI